MSDIFLQIPSQIVYYCLCTRNPIVLLLRDKHSIVTCISQYNKQTNKQINTTTNKQTNTKTRKMKTTLKEENKKISCSKDVHNILIKYFTEEREEVYFIGVNTKNKIKHIELIGLGSLDYSTIDSRIIYKRMFEKNLSGFFLAHNHPSGDITPSKEDINITEKINQQSQILDLKFLDHIIFSDNEYFSMFDNETGGF